MDIDPVALGQAVWDLVRAGAAIVAAGWAVNWWSSRK